MAQIDVTIVFDTDTIVGAGSGSQDPKKPSAVDNSHIYMVTDQSNALTGQGGGELKVGAHPGDEIRWQATSSTLASEYTVALYQFINATGGSMISTPQLNISELQYFYPTDSSNPLTFKAQTVYVPYWSANIEQPGNVTYHFYFTILNSSGKPVGYYWWDPFIQITFPS